MSSKKLEKRIRNYALKLHYQKKSPSFVSGAEYKKIHKIAHSGDIKTSDFVKSLKIELNKFGIIGTKYKNSSIGFCAETVSANRILEKVPNKLSELSVGIAIRPRTLQIGKKCKICKSLF